MNQKTILLIIFLACLFPIAFAQTLLPNGEAPFGIQYDGNFVSNNTKTLTAYDQGEIDRIASEGYNVLTMDVPAKWVWAANYSGNEETDFDFDGIEAVCNYAYTKGMYCSLQMVIDGIGYWGVGVGDYNLEKNFTITHPISQTNFPKTTPTWATDENTISMWDTDFNTIYFYANHALANHFATNPAVAMYIVNPNEGFGLRGAPENTVDANTYWQQTCLPSYYANKDAMNAAYGTSYAAFTNAPIPTDRTNFSVPHQYDWWRCKSERETMLFTEVARALKEPNPSKMVTSFKIPPLYLYPTTGPSEYGYSYAIDLNHYVTTTASYIDWVSCDPYPDGTTIKAQSLILDIRLAACKALGDSINKPVYIGEFFPTVITNPVTAGSRDDANFVSAMLGQTLAYVGDDLTSGVRGLSVFSWSWAYPALSIKNSKSETLFRDLNKVIKNTLKNATKTNNTDLAICDNTNINIAYNYDYWHYEPLEGFLQLYRTRDNNIIKFYFNNDCINATEAVLYGNQVNLWDNELLDLNTWVKNGGTLITGYRFADGNQTHRRNDGWESTSSRTALGEYLVGLTGVNTQANKLFDVNVSATETAFTNLSSTHRFFSCQVGAADRNCDYEAGTLGTGAVKQAQINATTGAGGDGTAITSKTIDLGKIIHFTFNLLAVFSSKNAADMNMTIAFSDLLEFGGKEMNDTNYLNFFAWTNPHFTALNAFGTTSGTYTYPVNSVVKTIDQNTITTATETSTSVNLGNAKNIIAFDADAWYLIPAPISITGTGSNVYGTTTTVTGVGCPSGLTCNLYRNNVLVNNPDTGILKVGTYVYDYNTIGDDDYNVTTTQETLTITKATPSLSISVNPSNPAPQGTTTTVTGVSCPSGLTCNLYRDKNLLSNPDVNNLTIGSYVYDYNTVGDANYEATTVQQILRIIQNTGVNASACGMVQTIFIALVGVLLVMIIMTIKSEFDMETLTLTIPIIIVVLISMVISNGFASIICVA